MVRLRSGVTEWSDAASKSYNAQTKRAKETVQSEMKQMTGVKIGYADPTGNGGTTTNGNTVRKGFYSHDNREFLISLSGLTDNTTDLQQLCYIGQRLSVLLRRANLSIVQ